MQSRARPFLPFLEEIWLLMELFGKASVEISESYIGGLLLKILLVKAVHVYICSKVSPQIRPIINKNTHQLLQYNVLLSISKLQSSSDIADSGFDKNIHLFLISISLPPLRRMMGNLGISIIEAGSPVEFHHSKSC